MGVQKRFSGLKRNLQQCRKYSAVAFVLAGFLWLHFQFHDLTRIDAPYENWDEVATYNNAHWMWTELRTRTYQYGFLDTAKMALARSWYAPETGEIPQSYSNNVPESWEPSSIDIQSRSWLQWSAIDFNYFRGVEDRRPIVLARELNLGPSLLISLAIVVFAAITFGPTAASLHGLFLFWFETSYEYGNNQIRFALPNATNALLAWLVTLLCVSALHFKRWRYLVIASVIVAVGMNHKIDFFPAGLGVLGAFFVLAAENLPQWRRHTLRLLAIATVFLFVWFATYPFLWFGPVAELKRQVDFLTPLTSATAPSKVNFDSLQLYLNRLFAPNSFGAPLSKSVFGWLGFSLVGVALGIGAASSRPRRYQITSFAILLILLVAPLLLIPLWKAVTLYHRYFLPGTAALLSLTASAIYAMVATRARFGMIAGALVTALLVAHGVARTVTLADAATAARVAFDARTGMDKRASRNAVTQAILEHSDELSSVVLVDQHGYFDLYALRAAGFQPRFINARNFDAVSASLPPARYGVLGVVGDYSIEPRWMGLWPEDVAGAYDVYLRRLTALPRIYEAGSQPAKLLDWRPPQVEDRAFAAVLEKRSQ